MRALILLLILSTLSAADAAPKPPDYVKDLVAMRDQLVAKPGASLEEQQQQERGWKAARIKVTADFLAHADFKPITHDDVLRVRGFEAVNASGTLMCGDAEELNHWMVAVHKADDPSNYDQQQMDHNRSMDGSGLHLYALYKNAPWALCLDQFFQPARAKKEAEIISTELANGQWESHRHERDMEAARETAAAAGR